MIEYERKFLVVSDAWQSEIASTRRLSQGYLAKNASNTVRVRVAGDSAWITIKGRQVGHGRPEYEYEIPVLDGEKMLGELAENSLLKDRYVLDRHPFSWTVDVFLGNSAGLTLLEVEDTNPIPELVLPSWVGKEVSNDPRYFNSYLSEVPFQSWPQQDPSA
jgi:adenylate cyclase